MARALPETGWGDSLTHPAGESACRVDLQQPEEDLVILLEWDDVGTGTLVTATAHDS